MKYIFNIFASLIILSIQLLALDNIKAGKSSFLVKDINNSVYWKGSYVISCCSEKNVSLNFQKVFKNADKLEARYDTFFAINNNGVLYGFGRNFADMQAGLLGNNSNDIAKSPIKIDFQEPLSDISTDGSTHTLAVTKSGNVYIWGDSVNNGVLGIDKDYETKTPMKLNNLSNIKSVAAGAMFSLALDKNGEIYGWGTNYYGQLALPDRKSYFTPTKIESSHIFTKIVACTWSAGAIDVNGDVYTWGQNVRGVLGHGDYNGNDQDYLNTPTKIEGLKNIVKLSGAGAHMLALDKDGNLYSWGENYKGEIGDGTTNTVISPKKLNLSNVIDIAAGDEFSLALTKDGKLYGWGDNANNLITEQNLTKVLSPMQIATPFKVKTDFTKLQPDKVSLNLKEGWNLAGLPNGIAANPQDLFNDYILWEYNNANWRVSSDCSCDLSKYPKVQTLKPGNGYWIHVNSDTTVNFDKFDYDLNKTDASKKSFGWSLLSNGKDGNISNILQNGVINIKDRKLVWKYTPEGWQYYTQDKNLSNILSGNYTSFNGEVKRGEGFWVYNDSYLYDYRDFHGSFHPPAYNKNFTTFVTPSLTVFNLKNNYITDMKTKALDYFGDYITDDKGEFIYLTSISTKHKGEVSIIKNDENLTTYPPYVSDGGIWNIKYIDKQLLIVHGSELEFVDTSNAPNLEKIFSIPCSGSYKITSNRIITVSKDGNASYLNVFDRSGFFIKKFKIVEGDSMSYAKIIIQNNIVYMGYFGYQHYPDNKTYLSGMVILNLNNFNFTNKVFGDVSLIPFYVEGDKIYLTKQDKYGGGLEIIDKGFNTLKNYNFSDMVYSFRKAFITKEGYLLTITSRQTGYGWIISLFDKSLNLLNEIKTGSYDDYNIALDENGYLLLYPNEFARDFIARLLQIKNDKLSLEGIKYLDVDSHFIKTGSNSAVVTNGKRFEVVNIDKFLNTFQKVSN